jgi:hypothetical protein
VFDRKQAWAEAVQHLNDQPMKAVVVYDETDRDSRTDIDAIRQAVSGTVELETVMIRENESPQDLVQRIDAPLVFLVRTPSMQEIIARFRSGDVMILTTGLGPRNTLPPGVRASVEENFCTAAAFLVEYSQGSENSGVVLVPSSVYTQR